MPAKRAQKRTRKAKSDQIRGDVEAEIVAPPPPEAPAMVLTAPLKEDVPAGGTVEVHADATAVSLFEDAPKLPERDELRPDQDLLEAEKALFKELLDKKMSLNERADKLVKLAGMTGNKTAPVALRAIQVINEITGVTRETDREAPSMFSLPEGVSVKVKVEVPEK